MNRRSKSSVAAPSRRLPRPLAPALLLVLALASSGCGQKGPLTLPQPAAPAASASTR